MKHGYPSGFKTRKSVNNVTTEDSNASTTAPTTSPLNLTTESIQGLLALLPTIAPTATASSNMVSVNTTSSPSGTYLIPWLVDTGTTDHISSSLDHFISYHEIAHVPVSLPNFHVSVACYKGTILLTPFITLYDTLYVPDFNSNIISISQLADTINAQCFF